MNFISIHDFIIIINWFLIYCCCCCCSYYYYSYRFCALSLPLFKSIIILHFSFPDIFAE